MASELFSPLVDVAVGVMRDYGQQFSTPELEGVRSVLDLFIMGRISFQHCFAQVQHYKGSLLAIQHVSVILAVPPTPLPSPADRSRFRLWTPEEDVRLLAGAHRFGVADWRRLAEFVGAGRSREQCSQRWKRNLDPRISRAGFTPAEDADLLHLYEMEPRSWEWIGQAMGNHTDLQCRYRFNQLKRQGKVPARILNARAPQRGRAAQPPRQVGRPPMMPSRPFARPPVSRMAAPSRPGIARPELNLGARDSSSSGRDFLGILGPGAAAAASTDPALDALLSDC
jgi:hypothetical protein